MRDQPGENGDWQLSQLQKYPGAGRGDVGNTPASNIRKGSKEGLNLMFNAPAEFQRPIRVSIDPSFGSRIV